MTLLKLTFAVGIAALATQAIADTDKIYSVSPGDDVRIGRAFDTLTGKFLQGDGCLDDKFEQFTDTHAQTEITTRLVEVSNTLGIMRALDIDVSASGKIFGSSVSGKLGFAQQAKLNQTSLNYTAFASYKAPPQRIKSQEGISDDGKRYLDQGEAAFRRKCGNAYVATIYQGAEAFGLLTFTDVSRDARQKISASASAAGLNWSASADLTATVNQQSENKNLILIYNETGGAETLGATDGTDADSSWSDLLRKVDGLKSRPPAYIAFQVLPYDGLPKWNRPPMQDNPDIVKLIYYRAAYKTLLNTVTPLVKAPFESEFTNVLGRHRGKGAGDEASLGSLQQTLLDGQGALKTLIDTCMSWTPPTKQEGEAKKAGACADTETLSSTLQDSSVAEDPYLLMARLPLAVHKTDYKSAFMLGDDLAKAIFEQTLLDARNGYCDQSAISGLATHPGCIDPNKLTDTYLREVRANVTDVWYPKPGAYEFQSLYRRDKTCLTAETGGSSSQRLFMQSCKKDRQRFDWRNTGQLRIRQGQCIAASVKDKAPLAPHNCISKEGVQMWRFIPLDRDAGSDKPGTKGLLREAGYGRCLYWGVPKSGKKTIVQTRPCNPRDSKQIWTFATR